MPPWFLLLLTIWFVSEHGHAKDLYVPRVEDKNRNMRMLKITTMDDLVKNSMNILEPSPLDASGNAREEGMKFI